MPDPGTEGGVKEQVFGAKLLKLDLELPSVPVSSSIKWRYSKLFLIRAFTELNEVISAKCLEQYPEHARCP